MNKVLLVLKDKIIFFVGLVIKATFACRIIMYFCLYLVVIDVNLLTLDQQECPATHLSTFYFYYIGSAHKAIYCTASTASTYRWRVGIILREYQRWCVNVCCECTVVL